MEASLLYKLHSNGIAPGVEVDKNRFREVFRSKYMKVRIYKVRSSQRAIDTAMKTRLVLTEIITHRNAYFIRNVDLISGER
jgi:ribosome biogenesis SPOUT family RNA methylase Rps3